ncbi:hypothetical protein CTAYLR_001474 [Chrysophaeum taylorii]|uniref:Cell cycle checkpoint protein RAD1 n=1 Tax=Chrysophaeum taylorii TaxID=2483200 RepID=A0AAD7U9B5_9STRA|nr:hypothetical protein CTAYLR_001474 [Chrysophaeum taylorii]
MSSSFAARFDEQCPAVGLLGCLVDAKRSEQAAHWVIDEDGLRVHVVGKSKSSFSTLNFPKAALGKYVCRGDLLTFSLDVASLVDCLQLFGTSPSEDRSITLTYEPSDAALKLMLEEQGVFTCCDVHVLDVVADLDSADDMRAAFSTSDEVSRVIADSATLRQVVAEFDDASGSSMIRVEISRGPPHFRLSAAGGIGAVEVDVPRAVFASFSAPPDPHVFSYHKDAFLRGMRALAYADQTSIAINERGMLKAQHMVPGAGADHVHVEYVCCSADLDAVYQQQQQDDNDEEEEEEDVSRRRRRRQRRGGPSISPTY